MKVKTRIKAGGITMQHNETLVRATGPAPALKVKTHIKAGSRCLGCGGNPNQTLVQAPRPATGLKVKTHIKAGKHIGNVKYEPF